MFYLSTATTNPSPFPNPKQLTNNKKTLKKPRNSLDFRLPHELLDLAGGLVRRLLVHSLLSRARRATRPRPVVPVVALDHHRGLRRLPV